LKTPVLDKSAKLSSLYSPSPYNRVIPRLFTQLLLPDQYQRNWAEIMPGGRNQGCGVGGYLVESESDS